MSLVLLASLLKGLNAPTFCERTAHPPTICPCPLSSRGGSPASQCEPEDGGVSEPAVSGRLLPQTVFSEEASQTPGEGTGFRPAWRSVQASLRVPRTRQQDAQLYRHGAPPWPAPRTFPRVHLCHFRVRIDSEMRKGQVKGHVHFAILLPPSAGPPWARRCSTLPSTRVPWTLVKQRTLHTGWAGLGGAWHSAFLRRCSPAGPGAPSPRWGSPRRTPALCHHPPAGSRVLLGPHRPQPRAGC